MQRFDPNPTLVTRAGASLADAYALYARLLDRDCPDWWHNLVESAAPGLHAEAELRRTARFGVFAGDHLVSWHVDRADAERAATAAPGTTVLPVCPEHPHRPDGHHEAMRAAAHRNARRMLHQLGD